MRCNGGGKSAAAIGLAALAAISSAPSMAADKVAIGPAGTWIVAVSAPADDGKGSDAPVKLLLRDEQADLHPGRITRYVESVFKVQTPQGLPAGAVSFAWNPDTQSATVHKLQIRRGAQVIDILASSQSFTVLRRETNLENAVLDGQLTASIQPEGLQVGDIVDFAVSITTSDPAILTHVEDVGAAWNGVPFGRVHLRAQWPSSVAMHIQADGGLPRPKIERRGDIASIEIAADDVQPLVLPKGAPRRYQYGRAIEMTDLSSWSGIAALMAPLYAKAEQIPANGALPAQIARIKAASPDAKARAEAALALVQNEVRYVFLGMNDGGLVPADAETTWSRRFGDCKGKTVLLLGLLHGLGIEAQPVLVSTAVGDGLDARLPEIGLFDHVLVRATIAGRAYWLDGTRVGDTSLDEIETPNLHWGLPLVPGSAALVAMVPAAYDRPQTDVAIRIDATGGLTQPAPIHIERMVRGDEAVVDNNALANLVGDARDRALRQFWKERYDFADPQTVTASFDPSKRTLRLAMDGTTKMDWNDGWYEADHVWVGYKADFSRDSGADKDAPYAVGYPVYTHVTETILLPPKAGVFTLTPGSDVDRTVAGLEYHRHARVDGDRFVVEESERSTAAEFPASQAPAAETTLRELARKSVFLNRPAGYGGVPKQVVAARGVATVGQAVQQLSQHGPEDAIAAADKAIAADPKNVRAHADRAMLYLAKADTITAKRDLDAAVALNPVDGEALLAKGLYARATGDNIGAIAALSGSLAVHPGNVMALGNRAELFAAMGQDDAALTDATAALLVQPRNVPLHLLRANILRHKGDRAGTAGEADALVATGPKDDYALVAAAKIYAAVGRQDDAMRTLDMALALKPAAYVYLNRYYIRPKGDMAGRQADLDAALKLDPSLREAGEAKAELLGERGDWRGATATLSTLLATAPNDHDLRNRRGIAYAKDGQQALAVADFDAARVAAKTPAALNNLCWNKATAGIALDRALGECDAALALAPDATNIRDSRAFVLLRLDRIDEALAEYGRVLARAPTLSASLYGRALAEARKGDKADADRDAAEALKEDPHTRERFEGFGLKMGSADKPDIKAAI